MEIGSREDAPFALFARFQRVEYPARGRCGGHDGAAGAVGLRSGGPLKSRGIQTIPPGDRLVVEMPGGGGLGDPHQREAAKVANDVQNGFVSLQQARALYGVALRDDYSVDVAATQELRRTSATKI